MMKSTNRPYLSVIVPVYKTEKYLDRCISSILKQTFTDFELLLIDDCSPDNAGAMCERYAAEDARIHVIHHPQNQGVAEVRNCGILHASGDFITFVDSDDFLPPDAFQALVQLQKETGADITIGSIKEILKLEDAFCANRDYPIHLYTQWEYAEIFFRIRGNRCEYYLPGKLFRREIAKSMRFPKGIAMGEDVVGMFQAICAAQTVAETERPLYWYFQNTSGITHSGFSQNDFDLLRVWDTVLNYSREHAPEYLEYAQLNRDRVSMTLLFRMNRDGVRVFPQQEQKLRAELRQTAEKLLKSPMPISRKAILLGYQIAYPFTRFLLGVAGRTGML